MVEVKIISGKNNPPKNKKYFTTVISKKKTNRAVDRNCLKRIFRTEYQKIKSNLRNHEIAVYYIGPVIKKLSRLEKESINGEAKKIFLSLVKQ